MKPDANKPATPARAPDAADLEAEKLARSIEFQFAQERRQRAAFLSAGGRTAFRIWSLVIIGVLLLAAIFLLEWMLAQIPRPAHRARPAGSAPSAASPAYFPEKR